jgi:hypothetical protein
VLFSKTGVAPSEAEATLPELPTRALLLTGLEPGTTYDVQLTSGFAPGAPVWRSIAEASDEGTLHLPWDVHKEARLRLRALKGGVE